MSELVGWVMKSKYTVEQMSEWIFFGGERGEIEASVLVELTLALREKDDNERLIACALRHVAWMEESF